jgi:hypothetical protein
MNLVDFKAIVEEQKKLNPFWFDDEADALAVENDIVSAERQLGLSFPEKYRGFLREFGGGYFAFTNVFSVDIDGAWYICEKNQEAKSYLPDNFLAISDDETGGFYGYVVTKGKLNEAIYYWDHESNSIGDKMFEDIFEYIVTIGLSD